VKNKKQRQSHGLEDYDLSPAEHVVLVKWQAEPGWQRRKGFLQKERKKYGRKRKPGSGNWTGRELDGTQSYGWQAVPEWRQIEWVICEAPGPRRHQRRVKVFK
jgi:hypothetical protein